MTLTEILIAMLVMALGLLGLFALFPLGLLNVTRAVTHNRSEALGQSALADLQVHNLLAPERYLVGANVPSVNNNPFIQDWAASTSASFPSPSIWAKQPGEPGLPVVIDPLWIRNNPNVLPAQRRLGRLGTWPDPIPDDGLQRVIPTDGLNNDTDTLTDATDTTGDGIPEGWPDQGEAFLSIAQMDALFAGRDDLVFREDDPSLPLLDVTSGSLVSERNYTWLAVAQLPDVSDPRTYRVAIATFFKRDLTNEQVLPAVYLPDPFDPSKPSNRVILRWPAAAAEPDLRREGWILDATYNVNSQSGPHRGYWYHYVQVSEPRVVASVPPEVHVTLTLDAPARETTGPITFNEGVLNPLSPTLIDGLDNNNNGLVDLEDFDPTGTQVNVAVILPGIVSVYERTVRAQ